MARDAGSGKGPRGGGMRWWKHGGEALSLSLTLSLFLSVVAKRVGEGVYGRWVVIFVPASSLISPHLLRAVALTPRRAAPRRTSPHRTMPRRATPRRDAGQRSRGAGWCAVVLVRMHISVPHILIQGVITRLSSAHSHHCLNHPPPPSSSSRQHLRSPRAALFHGPSPSTSVSSSSSTFFTSSHHRPPVALLRRPDHPI